MYLLDLFERRGEKEQCDLVCGAPLLKALDDWANAGLFDVLFSCGECGFNSLGRWSYSKEWMRNLGTKGMLHCFREVKCQLGHTPRI